MIKESSRQVLYPLLFYSWSHLCQIMIFYEWTWNRKSQFVMSVCKNMTSFSLNKLLKQEVLIWHVCLSEHDLFWINYWNRKSQFNSHLSEMSVTLMQSLYRCMWQNIESSKRSFSYQYHFLSWTLKKVTTKFPTQ